MAGVGSPPTSSLLGTDFSGRARDCWPPGPPHRPPPPPMPPALACPAGYDAPGWQTDATKIRKLLHPWAHFTGGPPPLQRMITENKRGELQTHTAFSSCVSRRHSDRPPTRCSGFLCVCLQSRSPQWLSWGLGWRERQERVWGGDGGRLSSPISAEAESWHHSASEAGLALWANTSPGVSSPDHIPPPHALSPAPFLGPCGAGVDVSPVQLWGHFGEPGRAQWPFSLPVGYLTRKNKIYAAFPRPPRASPAEIWPRWGTRLLQHLNHPQQPPRFWDTSSHSALSSLAPSTHAGAFLPVEKKCYPGPPPRPKVSSSMSTGLRSPEKGIALYPGFSRKPSSHPKSLPTRGALQSFTRGVGPWCHRPIGQMGKLRPGKAKDLLWTTVTQWLCLSLSSPQMPGLRAGPSQRPAWTAAAASGPGLWPSPRPHVIHCVPTARGITEKASLTAHPSSCPCCACLKSLTGYGARVLPSETPCSSVLLQLPLPWTAVAVPTPGPLHMPCPLPGPLLHMPLHSVSPIQSLGLC